jgi:geranylgeranyl diphosphate synthase type II
VIDLPAYLERRRREVDDYLAAWVNARRDPQAPRLWEAIEYSLLAEGKRVRPVLALAAAEAVGGTPEPVLPFACAIEMIHAMSLIHDDLPCMDDDDLRRGRPSCHKVFGEGIAVLAGDALFALAFELLADVGAWREIYHHDAVEVIHAIARAIGPSGMAGGQSLDLLSEGRDVDEPTLRLLQAGKTGALIRASVFAGARLAGADDRETGDLLAYADRIGLAFQIRDDLLDLTGDVRTLGKAAGKDVRRGKATFPAVLGRTAAEGLLERLTGEAVAALDRFSRSADPLRAIAGYLANRTA